MHLWLAASTKESFFGRFRNSRGIEGYVEVYGKEKTEDQNLSVAPLAVKMLAGMVMDVPLQDKV